MRLRGPSSAPSCRYGVATLGPGHTATLKPLNATWYLNFDISSPEEPVDREFVPMIRVVQQRTGCTRLPGYTVWPPLTDAGLGAAIRSHPGAMWIVGNEPDRGPNPDDTTCANRVQDDTAPEVYARGYAEVYGYIKQIDPTARVANAGLVEVTPGRLQYLDIVWNTYRTLYGVDMPVDVWTMHLYILPEAEPNGRPNGIANIAVGTDPALAIRDSGGDAARCSDPKVYCWAEHDDMSAFAGQVVAMRQWMKNHGQQQKPLVISEYSLLYPYEVDPGGCYLQDEYGNCFTPERVVKFVNNSLGYLESAADPGLGYGRDGNRLVQRWLWYGTWTQAVGYISNLTDASGAQLTAAGNAFAGRAGASARTVNLFPATASAGSVVAGSGSEPASALLTVDVRNVGTTPAGQGFAINFYRDAALTDLIGSAAVPAGLPGCESRTAVAQKRWSNLAPGRHSFWAKVDADGVVGETNESDNVIQGSVFIPTDRLWLPLTLRAAAR